MGPTTLVDKSFLQGLPHNLIYTLLKHYSLCIPSILIIEIQGDLAKKARPGKLPEDEVRFLAKKILGSDSYVCANYRKLCIDSLLGGQVEMKTGQVPIDGGRPIRGKDGKLGVFFDEPHVMKVVRRWQQGKFDEKDRELSDDYRATLKSFDLEKIKVDINRKTGKLKLRSLSEVVEHVDRFIGQEEQSAHLTHFLDTIIANQQLRTAVFNRWIAQKMPPMKTFAPYAFYCYRINSVFTTGVLSGQIPTRRTNFIDIQYLYYLPFSMVFTSGDKLHQDLAPLFMRPDQTFVPAQKLWDDLELLEADWKTLDDEGRGDRIVNYGSYPPQDERYLTFGIWKKYMKPWKPGSGNIASKLTDEQHKKIMEHIHERFGDVFKKGDEQSDG